MKRKILLAAVVISSILIACSSEHKAIKNENGTDRKELSFQYEHEGFITESVYRIVIVTPYGTDQSKSEIERQLKSRTLSSLQKYVSSRGRRISDNDRAFILNSIDDNGEISSLDDKDNSRVINFLQIKKDGFKSQIDSLGK